MSKYNVYQSLDKRYLLLDVQSDLLSGLSTRAVVPLLPIDESPKPATQLNPIFEIDADEYVMVTQYIASLQENELSDQVMNLQHHHHEITQALDMLFMGI